MEQRLFLFLFLFLFSLLSSLPAGKPDLDADRAALLALRAAVGRPVLNWNLSAVTPCSWSGVTCEANRVVKLRLPGAGLMGQIPTGALGNLTDLRLLSLRLNALSGTLPPDIASCSQLRSLYLQSNRFSGQIPASLFSLQKLIRLNLADNQFSGGIPPAFNNLTRLGTLYLESNKLSGQIPNLDLASLVLFNVSFNQLNGSVPAKLHSMPSNAFLGMSVCGAPLAACASDNTPSPSPSPSPSPVPGTGNVGDKSSKLSGGAIAGIAIGSAVGFLILLILLVILCQRMGSRRKSRSAEVSAGNLPEAEMALTDKRMVDGVGAATYPPPPPAAAVGQTKKLVYIGSGAKVYDLEDLLRASAEVLGKGTFGTTYKAVLEVGVAVAVKRLKDVTLPEGELKERIEAIGAMQHPNLVPMRAYFCSREEKLLVYDYMPIGSLSSLLHGSRGPSRTPLDWETRTGVALAASRGIEYIHSTGSRSSHGNIKSSNILLSKSYDDVRVSDHGLAQLVGPTSTPSDASGYHAPEVTNTRKVSQKADVYSFGVLLLELLTGKAPAQALLNEEGIDLPRWVQSVVREEWTSEVFDLELLRYQDVEDEMVQLLQLAIDCVAQYPDQRPAMPEVAARIEEIHQPSLSL